MRRPVEGTDRAAGVGALRSRSPAAPRGPGCSRSKASAVVERAHPVVVDALAVDELDAEVAQAGEAEGLRARRRVDGVDGHDHAVAGLHETDGRVRHADVGLEAAEHGRPAPGRLDRRHDLRAGGEVEDRLREYRRPADGQQHAHRRRPVPLRALFGEHGGHVQGHRRAGQPGSARRPPLLTSRRVALVEPVAPELGLQVDDDEDGVVPFEQRHDRLHGVDGSAGGRRHMPPPSGTIPPTCRAQRSCRAGPDEPLPAGQLGRTSHAARTARDGLLGEVGRARR